MAEGKKSFIAYSDWHGMFKALPDEVSGKLIKHIFSYVNDENPSTDDYVINALFEQIKSTLKRDLKKWDVQREQRVDAGKRSAELRALNKLNERSTVVENRERNSTVSVSVNVSVKEKEVLLNNSLLSEIKISDDKIFFIINNQEIETDQNALEYFTIAEKFRNLFIKNLKEKGSPFVHQEKATFKNYVSPIRLMIENKEATIAQLREAYSFLNSVDGEFWKSNILSTTALRKQISTLIAKKNMVKQPLKPKIEVPDHRKRNKI